MPTPIATDCVPRCLEYGIFSPVVSHCSNHLLLVVLLSPDPSAHFQPHLLTIHQVSSEAEVDAELSTFYNSFKGKESEENWEGREKALQRMRNLLAGQVFLFPGFFAQLKTVLEVVFPCVRPFTRKDNIFS